jgi:hypothetical protein
MSPSNFLYLLTIVRPVTYVLRNAVPWTTHPLSTEDRTASKIRSFSHLPPGWHYSAGSAPTQDIIEAAIKWNAELIRFGFHTTDAFPGINGEIMVTAYLGPHYVEILFDTDFRVSLTYENNNQELRCLERATEPAAFEALREIAGEIWSTSAYFTQNTSIDSATNSKAWPSRSMTMEHQSLNDSVWIPRATPSVNTFGGITKMSVESRPFSGFSKKASSLRTPA